MGGNMKKLLYAIGIVLLFCGCIYFLYPLFCGAWGYFDKDQDIITGDF
jgi:hypothetical protein